MTRSLLALLWWLVKWFNGEEDELPLPDREDPRTAATRRKMERDRRT